MRLRKVILAICVVCCFAAGAALSPHPAKAAEAPAADMGMQAGQYGEQNWMTKLALMKQLIAHFKTNNCAVALKPEDLMREVDAASQKWDPQQGDVTVAAKVCEMLKLDYPKCFEGK